MTPAVKRYVSYLRVSTKRQGSSGLGRDAQQQAVAEFLASNKGRLFAEVEEVESGKRADNRPQLQRALQLCKLHRATLIIGKLDRLSRNVQFISTLMNGDVEFVALDCREANRFTLHVLASVAEHEAAMISQRTKVALAAAKRRGQRLGGRRVSKDEFRAIAVKGRKASAVVRSAKAAEYRESLMPTIEEIKAGGITTQHGIAEELNRREIAAPRGGQWSQVQVMRLLA
jgi:DNA invertase Pin-like site-specific DNA recombinase